MVSAAILAGIVFNTDDPSLNVETAIEQDVLGIHDFDFEQMLNAIMKTGAVSNLPFVKEEDLVSLLTRDITTMQKADRIKLGSCERTVSALLAMQASSKDESNKNVLQSDLQRILKENVSSLDKAWALPACIAWNDSRAIVQLLEAAGFSTEAITCWLATAGKGELTNEVSKRLLESMEGTTEARTTWQRIKQKMKSRGTKKLALTVGDLRRAKAGELVTFSCGHVFTAPEFERSVALLKTNTAELLPLTSKLLTVSYQGNRFPLGCPDCVWNVVDSFLNFHHVK